MQSLRVNSDVVPVESIVGSASRCCTDRFFRRPSQNMRLVRALDSYSVESAISSGCNQVIASGVSMFKATMKVQSLRMNLDVVPDESIVGSASRCCTNRFLWRILNICYSPGSGFMFRGRHKWLWLYNLC